jgi:hypothetical protein
MNSNASQQTTGRHKNSRVVGASIHRLNIFAVHLCLLRDVRRQRDHHRFESCQLGFGLTPVHLTICSALQAQCCNSTQIQESQWFKPMAAIVVVIAVLLLCAQPTLSCMLLHVVLSWRRPASLSSQPAITSLSVGFCPMTLISLDL